MLTLRSRSFLCGALLFFATLLSYLPSLHAGFIWDDDAHVTRNWNLRSVEGLQRIWCDPLASPQYYPVSQTLLWVEYHVWGLWPAGYHACNLLLHALNVLLLWRLLKSLSIPGSWVAALLFAVHPVECETVAWIMESKTLLSTCFYLLALRTLLTFRRLDLDPRPPASRWRLYALASALFALALLSKSTAATLPAAFLLIAWWKSDPPLCRRDFGWMLPWFALGAASGIYTAILERSHVGAEGAEWALSAVDRFLIAGRALWFYAAKLVWPHPLIFFYPRWNIDAHSLWQYAFPAGVILVLAMLWLLRAKIGRSPLAAVLFFCGTLSPALGFLNFYPMRYSFVADHFQYLASVGLLTLIAGVGIGFLPRRMYFAAAILAATLLASLTFSRCFVYHDALTLYQDIVQRNPDSWGGHALLASVYEAKHDYANAAFHFAAASRLNPHVLENQEGYGAALLGEGDIAQAKAVLQEVLRKDPSRATAYNDLAAVFVLEKRPDVAISLYQRAIALNPNLPESQFNLGGLLAESGQFAAAGDAFGAALRLRPEWPEAALNLGRCLASQGRYAEAQRLFERALQLRPDWPDAREDLQAINALLSRPH